MYLNIYQSKHVGNGSGWGGTRTGLRTTALR